MAHDKSPFHSRPLVAVAQPLPLGATSSCELLEVRDLWGCQPTRGAFDPKGTRFQEKGDRKEASLRHYTHFFIRHALKVHDRGVRGPPASHYVASGRSQLPCCPRRSLSSHPTPAALPG